MLLESVYEAFPTQHACLRHLEKVLWDGKPGCPYCDSGQHTKIANDRYKCNYCNKSYRVTVNTVFHDTKCELQKWFLAIITFKDWNKNLSVRGLGHRIRVNKNSAFHIQKVLREEYSERPASFKRLADSLIHMIDRVEFEKWKRKIEY